MCWSAAQTKKKSSNETFESSIELYCSLHCVMARTREKGQKVRILIHEPYLSSWKWMENLIHLNAPLFHNKGS